MTKYVYLFKEGNANMRELLGGKGANLAEMTNLGLPVPQGFTVTTEACTRYYTDGKKIDDEIVEQIYAALAETEKIVGLIEGGLQRTDDEHLPGPDGPPHAARFENAAAADNVMQKPVHPRRRAEGMGGLAALPAAVHGIHVLKVLVGKQKQLGQGGASFGFVPNIMPKPSYILQ